MSTKVINVHIGEIKVARNGEILKTILGSCVGIAFIWKKKGICALAHCLLAESPTKSFAIDARFVDQAIPSLIALMRIHPENLGEIDVVLAGGGNMTQPGAKNLGKLVGTTNFNFAERELKKRGFNFVCLDQAAEEGRRITVYSENCTYLVEPIPRLLTAA